MNLMQSLLFLKACSSEEGDASVSLRDRTATLAPPSAFAGLHTCVHRLLDGNEAHRQSVLDINQLHVHKNVAQVALQVGTRGKKASALTNVPSGR